MKGNKADYLIAENDKGNKYFYKVVDPEVMGSKTPASKSTVSIIPNQTEHLNPSKWLTDENNQARLMGGISKVSEIETFRKTENSKEQEINNNDVSFFKFLDTLDNVSNSLMYKPDMSELFNNEDEDDNDYDKEENDVSGIEYVEVIENKKEAKEDMNKPLFKLRISEYEVLEFNTKEDYINYIGTILAKEIKKAVENRDYSDKYFKPARV